ncbi:hypothetical protein SM033_00045 [Vibrio phage vB_VpaM_sm033]|nr:hypothetical protein SM033_00045 [Vibrio phage vB_VpaM_sm033]
MAILHVINIATMHVPLANSLQAGNQRTSTSATSNSGDFQSWSIDNNFADFAPFEETTTGSIWIHFRAGSRDVAARFKSTNNADIAAVLIDGSDGLFKVYQGASLVSTITPTAGAVGSNDPHDWDIQITGNTVRIYRDGVIDGEDTAGWMGTSHPVNTLHGFAARALNGNRMTEIIVSDSDTRGMRLLTVDAESDGALTGFSGSYADISGDQLDPITFASATGASSQTYDYENIPTSAKAAGLVPEAVIIGTVASATSSSTAPFLANIVNDSGSPKECATPIGQGPDSHAGSLTTIMHTNPLTGQVWTNTDFDNMQFGVQALESDFEITVGKSASNEYGMATTVIFGSTTKAMTGETINRFFSKSGSPSEFNISFTGGSNGLISTGESKILVSVLVNGKGYEFTLEYDGSTRYEGVVPDGCRDDFVAAENTTVKAIIRPIS